MGYDSAIEQYNRIHEKVGLPAILDLWAGNDGPLHVYVHSPFCASICQFCYYKGVEFSVEEDGALYDRFYSSYLPAAVAPFRPMLETRPVGNYFFGGGTPSLMTPETMRSVFGLFPGLRDVESKTFEVHPAIWSEAQLDVLAEHGFNCCIIGVQSFDADVLARQRRLHAPFDRVQDLAEQIRRRGMHVAADLIYRMDDVDADEIFESDLRLIGEIGADVISLQLNYDEISDERHTARFFELILESGLDAGHYWEGGDQISLNLKKTLKCFRYVKRSIPASTYAESIFPFTTTLDEASKLPVGTRSLPSVIGFGSYRNPRKNTFSNIRDENRTVEYIEVNHDWTPEYFVTHRRENHDFFEECRKQLDMMRELGPPPVGMSVVLSNKAATTRENFIYRRVQSPVDVSVRWEYLNRDIEAYIGGLRRIFPHWNWWGD